MSGGGKMSIFIVETYVVKPEKNNEFLPALNEFLTFKESHPELFDGVRSWKLFRQEFGGIAGMYIEMWEYESMSEMERVNTIILSNDDMKRISQGFRQLIEASSFSTSIWYPVV
jgi:hypothetical protein